MPVPTRPPRDDLGTPNIIVACIVDQVLDDCLDEGF
jgi:hypothetical protein